MVQHHEVDVFDEMVAIIHHILVIEVEVDDERDENDVIELHIHDECDDRE